MINKICVCGSGSMGSGIALCAAQNGIEVILFDSNSMALEKASLQIHKQLNLLVEKKKILAEEVTQIFDRIFFTKNIENCIAPICIEAIFENFEAKILLLTELQKINNFNTVLATNTSSLSISKIAQHLNNSETIIGMHFFNPATIMKLVEVVVTPYTNSATQKIIFDLAKKMNKTAVLCKDAPGFIVNRVARPFYIESLRLIEENKSTIPQIDKLMENLGFKMGPFKLMDFIGNDINYAVSCLVYEQLNKPLRLTPSNIQKKNVDEGRLGLKSLNGFYEYKK